MAVPSARAREASQTQTAKIRLAFDVVPFSTLPAARILDPRPPPQRRLLLPTERPVDEPIGGLPRFGRKAMAPGRVGRHEFALGAEQPVDARRGPDAPLHALHLEVAVAHRRVDIKGARSDRGEDLREVKGEASRVFAISCSDAACSSADTTLSTPLPCSRRRNRNRSSRTHHLEPLVEGADEQQLCPPSETPTQPTRPASTSGSDSRRSTARRRSQIPFIVPLT